MRRFSQVPVPGGVCYVDLEEVVYVGEVDHDEAHRSLRPVTLRGGFVFNMIDDAQTMHALLKQDRDEGRRDGQTSVDIR